MINIIHSSLSKAEISALEININWIMAVNILLLYNPPLIDQWFGDSSHNLIP